MNISARQPVITYDSPVRFSVRCNILTKEATKKSVKKLLSVLLSVIVVATFPLNVTASANAGVDAALNQVIQKIQYSNPTAQIIVEDGVINVFIPETEEIKLNHAKSAGASTRAAETTFVAPEVGLWTSFKYPWYVYISPDSFTLPYCVTFLPADRALDVYLAMTTTGLMDFILENPITGAGVDAIAAEILTRFGLSLTEASVIFLFSASMLYLYDTINVNSFANALNSSSGAVRIDFTTLGGWPVNNYYGWDGITVTDSPWQSYSPVFHRGVYSTSDL